MAGLSKSEKKDRNRPWCHAYKASGKREISKLRRLVKHLKKHPNDVSAISALTPLTLYKNRAGVEIPDTKLKEATKRSYERRKRRELINKARKIVRLRYSPDYRHGKLAGVLAGMEVTDE